MLSTTPSQQTQTTSKSSTSSSSSNSSSSSSELDKPLLFYYTVKNNDLAMLKILFSHGIRPSSKDESTQLLNTSSYNNSQSTIVEFLTSEYTLSAEQTWQIFQLQQQQKKRLWSSSTAKDFFQAIEAANKMEQLNKAIHNYIQKVVPEKNFPTTIPTTLKALLKSSLLPDDQLKYLVVSLIESKELNHWKKPGLLMQFFPKRPIVLGGIISFLKYHIDNQESITGSVYLEIIQYLEENHVDLTSIKFKDYKSHKIINYQDLRPLIDAATTLKNKWIKQEKEQEQGKNSSSPKDLSDASLRHDLDKRPPAENPHAAPSNQGNDRTNRAHNALSASNDSLFGSANRHSAREQPQGPQELVSHHQAQILDNNNEKEPLTIVPVDDEATFNPSMFV